MGWLMALVWIAIEHHVFLELGLGLRVCSTGERENRRDRKIAADHSWPTHLGTTGDTSEADGFVSIDVEGAGDWLCGRRLDMVLETGRLPLRQRVIVRRSIQKTLFIVGWMDCSDWRVG